MGAMAKGVDTGVAAPVSTTMASPELDPPTADGPLAEPHQLQRASIAVAMFGPTRKPP